MLKSQIPREALMHLFVRMYNSFLVNRDSDEGKEKHGTKQVCGSLYYEFSICTIDRSNFGVLLVIHFNPFQKRCVYRINVPIERHTKEVCTQEQCLKSLVMNFMNQGFLICYQEQSRIRNLLSKMHSRKVKNIQ